jgi:hypothetical protein
MTAHKGGVMGDKAFGAVVVAVVLTGGVVGWTLASPTPPKSRVAHRAGPAARLEPAADGGPGAADREKVRQAVIEAANGLVRQPCDEASRQAFLQSVRSYSSRIGHGLKPGPAGSSSPGWGTQSDREVMDLITDLPRKGYVQPEEMAQAIVGSTAQGEIVVQIREMTGKRFSGQEDGSVTPACRRVAGGSGAGDPTPTRFQGPPLRGALSDASPDRAAALERRSVRPVP